MIRQFSETSGWGQCSKCGAFYPMSVLLVARLPQLHCSRIYATFARRVGILLTSSSRSAFQVSYAACMRTQTPAPSPNSLPMRTATAGDTGLRSPKISYRCVPGDPEELCNLGLCSSGGRNHILPQQSAGMCRTTIGIAFSNVNHLHLPQ
jgi:hypothetical protein